MLTISDFSQISGISRKTLIYYDKIDLFKPISVNEHGYRFYSFKQLSEISLIQELKLSNLSLAEIKQLIKYNDPHHIKSILSSQVDQLHQQIQRLERNLKVIEARLDNFNDQQPALQKVFVSHLDESYQISPVNESCDERDMLNSFFEFQKQSNWKMPGISLFGYRVNLNNPLDKYKNANFNFILESKAAESTQRVYGEFYSIYSIDKTSEIQSAISKINITAENYHKTLIGPLWQIQNFDYVNLKSTSKSIVRLSWRFE
ncbi:MerR family transcriptional regulator [Pediococcus claussenii]|uniref:Transcriptional regulator, MerR family n=1 Tax=Pediococcus claussenii (strain ATCC BAA-344 / DSM 14800 / JCM 18046 / KCTC 3811 / LMG 21948 / P06) TaxID=701521 RepID=G8PB98_PEDCP|nr:MerR family transcriptional regulator [Pediococcus claussenii]AEV95887.1 Transcriptional regulator, MerR family [Pediococcus claussenii ATCC BAA-344]ANZ69381.1 hypothetical protein AYR57_03255 [Pediococcus claussenii]ANZ71201.1 hypothetical protein AYR58_03270 [Pediococcus claussenii]KRN20494.1 hypothetical protein IV79_GL000549 [Pediococcus claussenii]